MRHIEWSTPQQRRLIIDEALGLLERHGMRFGHGDALEALAAAGAQVDRAAGVARIPPTLVEDALACCPREFVLGGATPEHDCHIVDGVPHHASSGAPTSILDHRTGKRRPATTDDLRQATSILDVIPAADIVWALVALTDCPAERWQLTHLSTMLASTQKHVMNDVEFHWQVPGTRRMAEAAGGDLRTRPRVSIVFCTASPLQAHTEMLDAATDLAAAGLPLVVMSMPIAGGTAPITVAGSVTVGVAEILGTITAVKLRAPEAKLFFSMVPGLLDMRQTTFAYGALEAHLQAALAVEVGHDLGLPVQAPGLSTDAKHPGIQAALEKALKGLIVTSAGCDLMSGLGMLESANLASLPQLIIDDEIAQMIHRLLGGVEITPQTIMAADIERLSFSAAYLTEKETRRRLRSGEQFLPLIADRSSYDHWQAVGKDELAVACERVEEILAAAEERGSYLDAGQQAVMEASIDEAAAAAPV
ncbi:MAG: trimethylamine methyltransferase family protein [Actinobacteria bacterium]|nr:trimethylamine methyltransferase family protein [Actinomycetota bacterium]